LRPAFDKSPGKEYKYDKCDTRRFDIMPLRLRIPPEKEKMIMTPAAKAGKTKSAFVLDAVDEKLGLVEDREQTIRKLSALLAAPEAVSQSEKEGRLHFFTLTLNWNFPMVCL
jgi:uncharacterized protein (DUF1778 family)